MIASMRNFNGVFVFPSIICPRKITRVREKCDLSGATRVFFLAVFVDIYLRQLTFCFLSVIARKHRLNML